MVAACALPMADPQSDAAGKRFETPPAGLGALYIYRTSDSPLDRTSRFRVMLVNDKGETRKLGILDDDTWYLLNLPPGNYSSLRGRGRQKPPAESNRENHATPLSASRSVAFLLLTLP